MRLPLSIHTTYQDLLESHRTHAVAGQAGTPFFKEISGGKYWYTRQRLGEQIVDRYIGPDSDDLRRRIAQMAKPSKMTKLSNSIARFWSRNFAPPAFQRSIARQGACSTQWRVSACFAWGEHWSGHMRSGSIVLNWALLFQARLQ